MIKFLKLFILCFLIQFTTPVFAKTMVNAEVESDTLNVGEGTLLTVTVRDDENSSEVGSPDISALSNDFEIGSSFQSSSFSSSYTNGQFVFEKIKHYKYQIIPTSVGEKEIPSIPVKVNGQVFKTAPIKVSVIKGSGLGSKHGNTQGNPNLSQGRQQKTQKANDSTVLVKAVADKSSAYIGEQIVVSYYLYTNVKIDSPDISKRPEFKGFIKEDLEDIKALHFTREDINGVPYNRALIGKYALYPVKTGQAVIDSMGIRALAYKQDSEETDDSDPFSGFGFKGFFNAMRPVEIIRESSEIKLDIKALPTANQPVSFTGAIGDFEIKAELNSNTTKAGQPISLIVRIKGRGNFSAIEQPKLALPPSIEIFESKATADISPLGSGEKTFEYVLLPKAEGTFNIDPVQFSYFRPAQNEYKTIKSQAFILTVKGGITDPNAYAQKQNSENTISSNNTMPTQKDIRYLKSSMNDGKTAMLLYKNPFFYAISGLIIMLIVLAYFVIKQFEKKSANIEEKRKKEVFYLLNKAHSAKSDDELLKNITMAINMAVEISKNNDEKDKKIIDSILSKINAMRFSSEAKVDQTKAEILKEAENLIKKMM